MTSCYDCIHCGACSDAGDSGFSSLKEDASECKHFKNKADVVSVEAFEQVKWERDTAIEQLWTYGIALCEKKELKEVKHGEWIEDGYNDIPCVCSRCGAEAPYKADCREDYDYDYDDNLIFLGAEIEKEYIKTPYCPNCGADMRDNKNESEVEK